MTSPSRHRRIARATLWSAALVGVCGAASVAAWQLVVVPGAERAAERRLGHRVSIGSLRLSPSRGGVVASDVTVFGKAPFDREVLAHLERVDVAITGGGRVRSVAVDGAELEFLATAQADNVRGSAGGGPKAGEAGPRDGFPVTVTRARLRGAIRVPAASIAFRAGAMDLTRDATGAVAAHARDVTIESRDGETRGSATLRSAAATLSFREGVSRIVAREASLTLPGAGSLLDQLALTATVDSAGLEAQLVRAAEPGEPGVQASLRADGNGADLRIHAESLPLRALAAVASRSGLELERARIGRFVVAAHADVAAARMAFTVALDAEGLGVRHPAIDRAPWRDLSASIAGEGAVELDHGRIELTSGRLRALGAELDVSGEISFADRARGVVHVASPPRGIACAPLVAAQPRPVAAALAGLALGGRLEAALRVEFDAADWDGLVLDLALPRLCRPITEPERLAKLLPILRSGTGPAPADERARAMPLGAYHRGYLPIDRMPPHLVSAFVTAEDGLFFGHRGFMLEGIRRALAHDLAVGAFARGASTITQQLAKNLFLTRDRTLARKLEEAVLAWRLDELVPKQRLLEIYLNVIELGPNIHGVENAARAYFGKSLAQLTPLESAHLASLAPNPVGFARRFRDGRVDDGWLHRLYDLLGMMKRNGRLSPAAFSAARAERLALRELPVPS